MFLITAIIPVKNGEVTLAKCLESISQQTIATQIEIIILDSTSKDKSKEIAERYGAKVIDLPEGTFNHGLTRNEGVRHASGELIFFTVQDAWLSETNQLEKMISHFTDKRIEAVNGIQGIPSDVDKNPALWFRRFTVPNTEIKYAQAFQNLSNEQQLELCRWDNVNAMYRRSALLALPFRKTDFAEDMLWAKDVLQKGLMLARDPSLLVYHYHHQNFKYSFRSTYISNYVIWKEFTVAPLFPSYVVEFCKNIFTIVKRRQLNFFLKIKWIAHNFCRLTGRYLSVLLFRLIVLLRNKNLLDKSYRIICSEIPQGISKRTIVKSKSY